MTHKTIFSDEEVGPKCFGKDGKSYSSGDGYEYQEDCNTCNRMCDTQGYWKTKCSAKACEDSSLEGGVGKEGTGKEK